MSVALRSPYQGNKRLLEENEEQEAQGDARVPFTEYNNPQKRVRHVVSPSGRCGSGQRHALPAYSIGASTLTALRALFPLMTDKAIADALTEFGDNVDAAIKHLNELQLSTPGTSKQHAVAEQHRMGILGPAEASTAAAEPDSAPSSGHSTPPQHPEHAAAAPARTAEQWIDALVQQMSAAVNVEDAKRRAAEVLRAFEQVLLQHSAQQGADTARENALLKRAVAIQNGRLHELAAKEAELESLRGGLEAARQRIQALEVQNYSLQVHLKRATEVQYSVLSPKNPDVF